MQVMKFIGMAIASFATFTLISATVPGWGRLGALVIITLAASPIFLEGSEDSPNPHGGIGALAVLFCIACLALAVGS